MARSAAALVAAMILPGSLAAQEPTAPLEVPSGTHTVVDFDTLWDLAQVYFDDPWVWPRIWDANRPLVENPDLIFPGWVLVIPGLRSETDTGVSEVTEIVVDPTPMPMPRRTDTLPVRTIFYEDPTAFQESVSALTEVSGGAM